MAGVPRLSRPGRARLLVERWRRAEAASAHDVYVRPSVRRVLALVAGACALVTLVGLIAFRPGGVERPDVTTVGATSEFYDGRVREIRTEPCPDIGVGGGPEVTCTVTVVQLLAGPDEGERVELSLDPSRPGRDLDPGDKVVLGHNPEAQSGFEYYFADVQRKPVLFWLAVLFALTVVALGRLRGVSALAGLAASLAVLLWFAVPAIIDGRSPVAVAVVAAATISFLALYLAHGLTPMTTVALLGTLASLALTAVLAVVFVGLARFTGFGSEEALFLSATAGEIDLEGLLLAGVVIGALGAVDDMTVTQASAVAELRAANPTLSSLQLYRAGLRIGRDHVASTVNTLVLAYAGASMPLLVLFVLSGQSLGAVANGEVVATEIVRTLVGSIGLVASVPLTTWLAARCLSPTRSTT